MMESVDIETRDYAHDGCSALSAMRHLGLKQLKIMNVETALSCFYQMKE